MSSYYEAELAKLRARDQDVDKAVQTGVTAGRGIADYLRMGFQDDLAVQQMELDKRMQDIRDKRAQREQEEYDLKMAKVRVGAEVDKAEREQSKQRERLYEEKLEELREQRLAREAANLDYNQSVDFVTKEKERLEQQAKDLGVDIGFGPGRALLGVTEDEGGRPTEPAPPSARPLTDIEAAAAALPYTGVMMRSLQPAKVAPSAEGGRDMVQQFTAVAPAGYGFDESGKLVVDRSGGMAKERSVGIRGEEGGEAFFDRDSLPSTPEFYRQDQIMSDEEIEKIAQDFAANLELEDKRQVVMQRLAEDPLNDEFFKLAGESGVAGFIDMAIDDNAAARAKAVKQAFENTLASKEASRKDKEVATKALNAIANVNRVANEAEETASDRAMDKLQYGLDLREQDRKEKETRAKIQRWNKSGDGRKRTREARDQYKRVFGDPLKALYKKQNKLALDADSISQSLISAQSPVVQSALDTGTKFQRDNLYKGSTAGMQLWNDVFAIPNGKEMLDDFVREHADAKIKDEDLRAKINAYAQQLLNQYGGKKLSQKEKEKNSAQNLASMAKVLSEEEYTQSEERLLSDSTPDQRKSADELAQKAVMEMYDNKGGNSWLDTQGQFMGLKEKAGESKEQQTQRRVRIARALKDEKYKEYLARMIVSSQGESR